MSTQTSFPTRSRYKATQVNLGLLEQVDCKRFEMRIYPIAPTPNNASK